MLPLAALVIALGAILGVVAGSIYAKFSSPNALSHHLSTIGRYTKSLLVGDFKNFWFYYRSIVFQTGRYFFYQIALISLSLLPLLVVLKTSGAWMNSQWNHKVPLTIYPEYSGEIVCLKPKDSPTQNCLLKLRKGGKQISIAPESVSVIAPEDSFYPIIVELLSLQPVVTITVPPHQAEGTIIVRPGPTCVNPFFPYVSDMEFSLFVAFSISSILTTFLWMRKREKTPHAIEGVDRLLFIVADLGKNFFYKLGNLESRLMTRKLCDVRIDRPIFLSGLARSGTTILLEVLSKADGVATHKYRDYPFIFTPVLWNKCLNLFQSSSQRIARPHQDGILINRESPEAFEEPLWQFFFPNIHAPGSVQTLVPKQDSEPFNTFFTNHIRKIQHIRKGSRYLSKGNYNLTRIPYLLNLFPDARFIIPVRHPFTHVQSLVRQNDLFTGYAQNDPMVPEYLASVGHYEFGPQRVPIYIDNARGQQTLEAWSQNAEVKGYALQWASVYGYIQELFEDTRYKDKILIVRYEDLCQAPQKTIGKIVEFSELNESIDVAQVSKIISSNTGRSNTMTDEQTTLCWETVLSVAINYGYSPNPETTPTGK